MKQLLKSTSISLPYSYLLPVAPMLCSHNFTVT